MVCFIVGNFLPKISAIGKAIKAGSSAICTCQINPINNPKMGKTNSLPRVIWIKQ